MDSDASGDDCSIFIAGNPGSCGRCDYTAPVTGVTEACDVFVDCSFTAGDPSTCNSTGGCTYTAPVTEIPPTHEHEHTRLVDEYHCECVAGYTCHDCECDLDECLSAPCLNGATCEDSLDSRWDRWSRRWKPVSPIDAFNCTCAPGFANGITADGLADGSTVGICAIDVDECLSEPCFNGGTCTAGWDMFTCTCMPGWEGERCELDIDECRSGPFGRRHWANYPHGPCKNGGLCAEADVIDAFTCTCVPGYGFSLWEPDTCDLDLDECASGPCKFGAKCTDSRGDPACGFVGMVGCTACEYSVGDGTGGTEVLLGEAPGTVECTAMVLDMEPTANGATYAAVDPRWDQHLGFWCGPEHTMHAYATQEEAEDACAIQEDCKSVYDQDCDGAGPWHTCSAAEDGWKPFSASSCMYLKAGKCYAEFNATGKRLDPDWKTCLFTEACVPTSRNTRAPVPTRCNIPLLTYQCQCTPGWAGPDCDIDFDECSSIPCRNGGDCADSTSDASFRINTYGCSCDPGFEGSDCEVDIDECASSPCFGQVLNNCADLVDAYACVCADGYEGHNCEDDFNECASGPCRNGGACSHEFGVFAFTCDCPSGFIGHQCEIDVDDCESRPCYRGGTCSDRVDAFHCDCTPGWTGDRCQADYDECLSRPCLHHGSCDDMSTCADRSSCMFDNVSLTCSESSPTCIDNYNCTCRVGFFGLDCEVNFDECASDPCIDLPCENPPCADAICNDGPGDYVCTCRPGTGGKNCDMRVDSYDPCLQDPDCRWKMILGGIGSFLGLVLIPCTVYFCFVYFKARRQALCVTPYLEYQAKREEKAELAARQLRKLQWRVRRAVNANRVELSVAFKKSDTDKSNTLNAKELAMILGEFRVKIDEKQVKQLLRAMDDDGDSTTTVHPTRCLSVWH